MKTALEIYGNDLMKKTMNEFFAGLLLICPFIGCIVSIIALGLIFIFKDDLVALEDMELNTDCQFARCILTLTMGGMFSAWMTGSIIATW